MNAIAGHDLRDSTSLDAPVPDYTKNLGRDLKGIRIGLPKEYMIEGVDPAVKTRGHGFGESNCKHSARKLSRFRFRIPITPSAFYYIWQLPKRQPTSLALMVSATAHRADNVRSLFDHYARTREEGFGAEVKRRIILGTYVLSSGYYDAYYLRAQKVRELIRRDFVRKAFEKVDASVSPTTPNTRVQTGRENSRSIANVSGRHFHDRSKPRRDLRDQCSLWVCQLREQEEVADWVAATRKSARRGAHFSDRPCLRTKHRLAQGRAQTQLADCVDEALTQSYDVIARLAGLARRLRLRPRGFSCAFCLSRPRSPSP